MLDIERDDDEILAITINGEAVDSQDGESWTVPKALLHNIPLNQLPLGVDFDICSSIQESVIMIDTIPMTLTRTGEGQAMVGFDDSGTRKYWDGAVGFKPYMEAKKAVVETRAKEIGDVIFESYEDDGAWISLRYSAQFNVDACRTAIELAEQLVGEIEGAADMALGATPLRLSDAADEKEFTLTLVLPLLRRLGFCNVRYNHGRREYGKDVVFARRTEFDDLEHWAAQIKVGDIHGGVNATIDGILGQIDDAFKMPFYDIYTRQRQRISKLAIITSGHFTENATEKICDKIESHAIRNNLVFLDRAKLDTFIERLRTP
jgi:hypothetical protein